MFPVILQNLRPSGVLFSKSTVCEKFQIAREKVVVNDYLTYLVITIQQVDTLNVINAPFDRVQVQVENILEHNSLISLDAPCFSWGHGPRVPPVASLCTKY